MSKVFRITPKRIKRSNGQMLTPEMSITVTTRSHTTTPFYNGAVEIKEHYMRMYQFDYKKACCSASDFEFENYFRNFKEKWTLRRVRNYIPCPECANI